MIMFALDLSNLEMKTGELIFFQQVILHLKISQIFSKVMGLIRENLWKLRKTSKSSFIVIFYWFFQFFLGKIGTVMYLEFRIQSCVCTLLWIFVTFIDISFKRGKILEYKWQEFFDFIHFSSFFFKFSHV